MRFSGEVAILDKYEVVELLEATAEGKALVKRQPDSFFRLESVDLSRIIILPDKYSVSLKELTEKIQKGDTK